MDTRHDRCPVAVHCFRERDGHVLLLRRAGSGYADGLFGLPAGHVDLGETPEQAAVREVREEIGLELDPAELITGVTFFRLSLEPRVDFFYLVRHWTGTPRICEPEKCTELAWAVPDAMPEDALPYLAPAYHDSTAGVVRRSISFPTT